MNMAPFFYWENAAITLALVSVYGAKLQGR
jgi:hypothetical protein